MIRNISFVTLAILSLCLSACNKPDLATLSGSGAYIASGEWQFVNYWATWCAPCREEIPALNDFSRQDNVRVYGVNYDGLEGSELADAIAEMDIRFDSLLADPATALEQSRPRVLPTTFVINPAGEVVRVLTGPQTEETLRSVMQAGD